MNKLFYFLESKYAYLLFSIIWKIILDLSYVLYVGKYFEYSGFLNNFDYSTYILSWILCFVGLFFSSKVINKPSDFFICFFLHIAIFPLLTFISFNAIYSYSTVIVVFLSYILIYLYCNFKFFKVVRVANVKNGPIILKYVSFALIGYLIFWYVISGAVNNFNLDLSKVYEFREINAELTNVGFLAYLNSWVYQIFTVALMCYALLKKNYLFFGVLCVIQTFFFGVNAHKSILFAPLMIYIIYFYFSSTKALSILPLLLSIMVGGMLVLSFYNPISILPSMFIRRTFFVPAFLTFNYFEFFSNHSFNYWSNSIFKSFLPEIYPEGVSKEVGNYLGSGTNANNGFISSGYAQFGYVGVLIYVLILSYILKFCDYLSEKIGSNWFCICLLIIPIRNVFLSSDLFTTLLTHGLLVSIFILILVRTSNDNGYQK
ncbi:hypothetical protein [Acinetobacter sp. YH1901134]|uniref:hypothetical protein n=1 Tax=Acinetobacter sp. YH1901134 TaxID=2601199 RepID=UPI0015D2425A|nr:hypothetical protein [Acinetobacter sp. YH1901134]